MALGVLYLVLRGGNTPEHLLIELALHAVLLLVTLCVLGHGWLAVHGVGEFRVLSAGRLCGRGEPDGCETGALVFGVLCYQVLERVPPWGVQGFPWQACREINSGFFFLL